MNLEPTNSSILIPAPWTRSGTSVRRGHLAPVAVGRGEGAAPTPAAEHGVLIFALENFEDAVAYSALTVRC